MRQKPKIKGNAYQYQNLTTYPKGAILGLTKKLSATFYGQGNQLEKMEPVLDLAGLDYDSEHYDSNGTVFLFTEPKKIEKSQTELGKNWLRDYFFKKDGQPRSGKRTENLDPLVLGIAKKVSKFRFIGVLALKNTFGEYVQFLPIYRTYNRSGQYFDYAPIHWGQPVIVSLGGE
jgi:hypothetical protein